MNKSNNKFISIISLVVLLASLFSPIMGYAADSTQEEIEFRRQDINFYDPFATSTCGSQTGGYFGRDIMFIGDSIGVGLTNNIGELPSKLDGWIGTYDVLGGRPLQGYSVTGQERLDEYATPESGLLASSRIVVMELGTNVALYGGRSQVSQFNNDDKERFKDHIEEAVDTIREANPGSTIIWMDSPATIQPRTYSLVNQAIYEQAAELDYRVFSLFDTVFPAGSNGSPQNIASRSSNTNVSTDGYHLTPTGYRFAADRFAAYLEGSFPKPETGIIYNGGNNAEVAFNYLRAKGLTASQAAGVLGNLQKESGINPRSMQGGNGTLEFSDPSQIRPGLGFGIAQWTSGGRQENWLKYAADRGADPMTIELQLDFLWWEFQTYYGPGYQAMLRANDIRQATWVFLSYFEIPRPIVDDNAARQEQQPTSSQPNALDELNERTEFATAIGEQYGGNEVIVSSGSGCSSGLLSDDLTDPGDFAAKPQIQRDTTPPGAHNPANCTGTFTPGAEALRTYIRERWSPHVTGIGGYTCRALDFDNSKQTSIHGVGRALDIMIDATNPTTAEVGYQIRNWLYNNAEQLGVQTIIWDRHIWTSPKDGWRPFSGSAHIDHIHTDINIEAGNNANLI